MVGAVFIYAVCVAGYVVAVGVVDVAVYAGIDVDGVVCVGVCCVGGVRVVCVDVVRAIQHVAVCDCVVIVGIAGDVAMRWRCGVLRCCLCWH